MQKKLIALAIAGLSGAAFAQSNVTVYGQVNMSYQNASGTYTTPAGAMVVGAAGSTNSIKSIRNHDSRLGFKGEENLGNGLKAVFTAEFGFNPDQNGGLTSNAAGLSGLEGSARQTFVGVSSNWGTVTVGRQYTPFFEAAAAIDPFGASTTHAASVASLHPIVAVARANNAFKYVGAFDMAGGKLIAAAMFGLSERATDADVAGGANDTGKMNNWKLAYAGGPLLVGITQIKLYDNVAGAALAAGQTDATTKATAIGGTYDLKVAKLHVLNDRVKATVDGATAADRTDWMLGVSVPMGAHTFKGAYNKVNDKLAANADSKHIGLGYAYAMSKRTSLFANFGKVSNTNGAAFAVTGTGRTKAYQLGMAHSF